MAGERGGQVGQLKTGKLVSQIDGLAGGGKRLPPTQLRLQKERLLGEIFFGEKFG